jgi:hypothetical protein
MKDRSAWCDMASIETLMCGSVLLIQMAVVRCCWLPDLVVSFDCFLRYIGTRRLYACLRLACGWILWHIRKVDDGMFRRHVCEALLVCYVLQALTVLRAQFTDRHLMVNWLAIVILGSLAGCYASFRFGKGGSLIKIYELPTSNASTLN